MVVDLQHTREKKSLHVSAFRAKSNTRGYDTGSRFFGSQARNEEGILESEPLNDHQFSLYRF